jgi:LysM repeat protein
MKFSKVFSLVLFLHLGVIAVFILQPGCRTTQPPTRVDAVSEPMGNGRMVTSSRSDLAGDIIVDEEAVEERRRAAPRRPQATAADDDGFGDLFADAFNPSMDEPGLSIPVAERGQTTHTVQRGESLWAISRQYSISVAELAELNNLSRDAVLRVGQELKVPTDGSTMTTTSPRVDTFQPSGMEASTTSYTVQRGDTLSGIARRHNTTVQAIKAANSKTSDTIRVGEELRIPGQADSAPAASAPAAPRAQQAQAAADGEHVVRAGEFPGSIARQYGMTTQELLTLNNITDPRTLQVGQRLRVRSGNGSATTATASQPSAPAPTAPRPQATAPSAPRATPAPTAPTVPQPVRIRTVEAEPLPEGAFPDEIEDEDALFRDAVEIPVIRLNEN